MPAFAGMTIHCVALRRPLARRETLRRLTTELLWVQLLTQSKNDQRTEMLEQPRSRRQTRAAILGHLLQSGGAFRPPLAKAARLSEPSLSRILFDLKAEGLIEEVRRPAPYV